MQIVAESAERRRRLNESVLKYADLSAKRFFADDRDVCVDGALPARTKEPLG